MDGQTDGHSQANKQFPLKLSSIFHLWRGRERKSCFVVIKSHFICAVFSSLSVGRSVVWLATTRKSHIWTASSNFLEWPQFKVGHCYWHSSGDRDQLFAVQIRSNNFPINLCCVLESFSSLFSVPNNTSTFCCGKMLQKRIVLLVALFSFFSFFYSRRPS